MLTPRGRGDQTFSTFLVCIIHMQNRGGKGFQIACKISYLTNVCHVRILIFMLRKLRVSVK